MKSVSVELRHLRVRFIAGVMAFALVVILTFSDTAGATSPSQEVQSATLTMTSDPGDSIGGGLSYSYATPGSLFLTALSGPGLQNEIRITVRTPPSGTDFWFVDLAAPPGDLLGSGTYTGAVRTVSRGPGQPGMDISGLGQGCSALTGNFTVLDVVYGPFDYVQSFHATFEQHCEGREPALRGEVILVNPPAPDNSVQLTIDAMGELTRAGSVTVHGTITCNGQIDPNASVVELTVSEPSKKGDITGTGAFAVSADCSSAPTPWTAIVTPNDRKLPFVKGTGTVNAHAMVFDTFYGAFVHADATGTVTFKET